MRLVSFDVATRDDQTRTFAMSGLFAVSQLAALFLPEKASSVSKIGKESGPLSALSVIWILLRPLKSRIVEFLDDLKMRRNASTRLWQFPAYVSSGPNMFPQHIQS